MKEELMTEVMQQMLPYLDNAQLKQLRQVMEQTLYHYEVTGAEARPEEDDSNDLTVRRMHDGKRPRNSSPSMAASFARPPAMCSRCRRSASPSRTSRSCSRSVRTLA